MPARDLRMPSAPNPSRPTSFRTTTSQSTVTGSSESTEFAAGPGATAGRYIYRLGSFVIHQYEHVVIQRTILSIRSHFPHTDQHPVPDQFYDDLLELSRPDLYNDNKSVQRQALQILLKQIGKRQVAQLMKRMLMLKWPEGEVYLVLRKLSTCLPQAWRDQSVPGIWHEQQELCQSYLSACDKEHGHYILPFLDFLLQLSQVDKDIRQCAVRVARSFQRLANTHHHPFHVLCAKRDENKEIVPLSLLAIKYSPAQRRKTWQALGSSIISRRKEEIGDVLNGDPSLQPQDSFFDDCIDLLDFASSSGYQPEITAFATASLIRIILSDDSRLTFTLSKALAAVLYDEQLHVLSSLSCYLKPENPFEYCRNDSTVGAFQPDVFGCTQSHAVNCFIKFAAQSISRYPDLQRPLRDSSFLPFFLFIVAEYFGLANTLHSTHFSDRYHVAEKILRHLSGDELPHVLADEEQRSIWIQVVDTFGQHPETYLTLKPVPISQDSLETLPGPTIQIHPSRVLHSTLSVALHVSKPWEEFYLIRVTPNPEDSHPEWVIYKRLADLVELDRIVRSKAPGAQRSVKQNPRFWKEYLLLDTGQKENFIKDFLQGLLRLPSWHQTNAVVEFLTTDVSRMDFVSPTSPVEGRFSTDRSKDTNETASAMSPEERFLVVGKQVGLL